MTRFLEPTFFPTTATSASTPVLILEAALDKSHEMEPCSIIRRMPHLIYTADIQHSLNLPFSLLL